MFTGVLMELFEGKHVRVTIKSTLLSLSLGLQLVRSSYLCLLRTARPRYCGICQGGVTCVCVRFRVYFSFLLLRLNLHSCLTVVSTLS